MGRWKITKARFELIKNKTVGSLRSVALYKLCIITFSSVSSYSHILMKTKVSLAARSIMPSKLVNVRDFIKIFNSVIYSELTNFYAEIYLNHCLRVKCN